MTHLLNGSAWHPQLDGALADRALAAVRDIGRAIVGAAHAVMADDASLAGGLSGAAVLFAHMHHVWPSDGYDLAADGALSRAATLIATTRTAPSFYAGFPGMAWAMAYVGGRLHPGARDRGAEIDRAVRAYVGRTPWRGDYDLVSGLVGLGVYALERLPSEEAAACAGAVVARLAETAVQSDDGITWHTSPDFLPLQQRPMCPAGYDNLGLAHGVPGVIALLGSMCGAGLSCEIAEPLLRGAVTWLLAQPEAAAESAGFPAWVASGQERTAARVAWCYGDLGIAAALMLAAQQVGEQSWERAALRFARRAAARPIESSGVVDAGLCHGAAGVGHLFNRLHAATGDACLSEAAGRWFARTLDMREPGTGVAGYRSYLPANSDQAWIDDPSLLTGATGVGLALLAAATYDEPAWDRLLLISPSHPAARRE